MVLRNVKYQITYVNAHAEFYIYKKCELLI